MSFRDGTMTLRMHGELDVLSAPSLSAQLTRVLDQSPQALVFDLTDLAYLDCAGAHTLADAGRALPAGRRPVLRSPGPAVRRLLELAGLDTQVAVEN